MPDGKTLQCYSLHIAGDIQVVGAHNAICLAESTDGGKTWTPPQPIVCNKGRACWDELPSEAKKGDRGKNYYTYRSPWAILLGDGRILVVYARRIPPMGIGGTISADGGKTWSEEFVIRGGDCSCWDIGYPVGCQVEDGRVFIAYYYTEPGNDIGVLHAVRYIAGTSFRVV
jgi:hypothetical protein